MFRRLSLTAVPAVALAALLVAAEPSLAQSSFEGDWPHWGHGSGYGHSGFARWRRRAAPFPYRGLSGSYAAPYYTGPASAGVPTYQAYYPAVPATRAYIQVRVPSGSHVFFDDTPTTQTGTDRRFTTPPLEDGHTYVYQVTAHWTQDGRERTATQSVRVVPGQTTNVDFPGS